MDFSYILEMIDWKLVLLIISFLFPLYCLSKWIVLQLFGIKTLAVIEEKYCDLLGEDSQISYSFDDMLFEEVNVSKKLYEANNIGSKIEVIYLERYPQINMVASEALKKLKVYILMFFFIGFFLYAYLVPISIHLGEPMPQY